MRVAGVDLAFRRNASALALVRSSDRRLYVDAVREWVPTPKRPLVPSDVCASVVRSTLAYGADIVIADVHYRDTLQEHTAAAGLGLQLAPSSSDDIAAAYTLFRIMLRERRVTIARDARDVVGQLRDVVVTHTDGGVMQIRQGATDGGRHGDMVSATIAGVWALRHELGGLTGRPVSDRSRLQRRADTIDDDGAFESDVITSRGRVLF